MFSFFKRRKQNQQAVASLYEKIVAEARREPYFIDLGVPDTVDGRFDMLASIVYLVLRRYRGTGHDAEGQLLFDTLFHDMDRSLREMGAGDLGVAPRVKNMVKAFFGRVKSYDAGLDDPEGDAALTDALSRNLYRKTEPSDATVAAMAARFRLIEGHLAGQAPEAIVSGVITFPDFDAPLATQPEKVSA